MLICVFFFFFFQAEDGIRDLIVTGVQTCALPIAKVSPSVSPTLAQHVVCAKAWLLRGSPKGKTALSKSSSLGARSMCRLLTCPTTVLVQETAGGPLQNEGLRALTTAGITIPPQT